MESAQARAVVRDRRIERHAEAVSRALWPWRTRWLPVAAGLAAAADFATTYAALELSGREFLRESGLLAGWALDSGGFAGLLLADAAAVAVLILAAVAVRRVYARAGFNGAGRAAFVVVLAPYLVVTAGAVLNNLLMAFL